MTAVPLLAVENLTMRFGGLVAVDDVSFTAYRGEITAIIGPNGAGKTTVFNCLTGFYRPSAGRLAMHKGAEILQLDRIEGFRIVRRAGIARTFQNIRLFAGMTVLENPDRPPTHPAEEGERFFPPRAPRPAALPRCAAGRRRARAALA